MKHLRTSILLALAAAPFSASAADPTPVIEVTGEAPTQPLAAQPVPAPALEAARARTSDTAELLTTVPGVSVTAAGAVSGLPMIQGLGDERINTQIDGMSLIATCPNHMNSPLSYIDPTQVGKATVYTGVVPVTVNGDSIGGAIVVESPDPVFAAAGQTRTAGEIGGWYRSNGRGFGGNLDASFATHNFSLRYQGSSAQADNYRAGGDFKQPGLSSANPKDQALGISHWLDGNEVGSTAYKAQNHLLTAALQNDAATQLLELKLGVQHIPYEYYPNQRMDMTANNSTQANLRYRGLFDWGRLDARLYHQVVKHEMQFGDDRQYWYMTAPGMPMDTESHTTGAKLSAAFDLTARDVLTLGTEWQKFRLDDWWPPSGTGGMSPGTFWNINNGQRDRYDLFADWKRQWTQSWQTEAGVRLSNIRQNADPVRGYSTQPGVTSYMMTAQDAAAFNAANRERTDHNLNASLLARYTPQPGVRYEFGIGRQTRSPSLYELYPWSSWGMAAIMNNFVGDGNGYVGNLALKPEKATTLSASAEWSDAANQHWQIRVAPYYSRVTDYIDARCYPGKVCLPNQYNVLQYVNANARLYGADFSGQYLIAQTESLGQWTVKGQISYTHGRNTDTGEGLYNIVPWVGKVALEQQWGGWRNTVETVFAGAKTDTSTVRGEVQTGGYALLNLRTEYRWHRWTVAAGIDNLFNRYYALPQGGVYVGQGMTMSINGVPYGIPVPGPGRSFFTRVSYRF